MKKSLKKEGLKVIVAGSLATALFGGVFLAANDYVFGSSMDKPIPLSSSLQTAAAPAEQVSATPKVNAAAAINSPAKYQEADYTVLENDLLPRSNTNAISAEVAAKIGAQYLWDIFQADLSGKIVYMSFSVDPSTRIGHWHGDIYENKTELGGVATPGYSFSIEAISGKRSSATRNFDKIPVTKTILYKEADAKTRFKDSISEFSVMAEKIAQQQLPGKVVKTEFSGSSSVLPPGFTFQKPAGMTDTFAVSEPLPEMPDLTEVPMDSEYQAAHVFITILVTDADKNQVAVEFDLGSKLLIDISGIYSGIDYDPGSLG